MVLLAIAAYDNLQVDLVHNVLADPKINQLPEYKSFLSHFVTDELAQWPLPEHELIMKNEMLSAGADAAKQEGAKLDGEKTWFYGMLRDRVVEHDIRVVAKYYTRINTLRLAEMLQLSVDKTEEYLSSMVTSESTARLDARIDRPAGIVSFQLRKNPNEHLTEWTGKCSGVACCVWIEGKVDSRCFYRQYLRPVEPRREDMPFDIQGEHDLSDQIGLIWSKGCVAVYIRDSCNKSNCRTHRQC